MTTSWFSHWGLVVRHSPAGSLWLPGGRQSLGSTAGRGGNASPGPGLVQRMSRGHQLSPSRDCLSSGNAAESLFSEKFSHQKSNLEQTPSCIPLIYLYSPKYVRKKIGTITSEVMRRWKLLWVWLWRGRIQQRLCCCCRFYVACTQILKRLQNPDRCLDNQTDWLSLFVCLFFSFCWFEAKDPSKDLHKGTAVCKWYFLT